MYQVIDKHKGEDVLHSILDNTGIRSDNINKIRSIGYDQYIILDRSNNQYLYDMILGTSRKLSKRQNLAFELSLRIKTIMNRKNISEKELSELTEIHQSTLNRYLKGETAPNAISIRKIAQSLNCRIDDFFYDKF